MKRNIRFRRPLGARQLTVCRFHGARGVVPRGEANGSYKLGLQRLLQAWPTYGRGQSGTPPVIIKPSPAIAEDDRRREVAAPCVMQKLGARKPMTSSLAVRRTQCLLSGKKRT
jgi:hypothetical protein